MRTSLVLGCVFLLFVSCRGQICPTDIGWLKIGDHCLKFVAYPELDRSSASAFCQDDGATLVSVSTQEKHLFVKNWLKNNDERRDEWLTSGMIRGAGIRWGGDGSVTTNMDHWTVTQAYRISGAAVLYKMNDQDLEFGWFPGDPSRGTKYSFICEIDIDEVYRINQQHRDFDYGLNLDNPSLAPRGPMFLQQPEDTMVLQETPSVYLECLASGNPEPSYEWLKQGADQKMALIPQGPRFSFTTGKLEISNPTTVDESRYQCKATNPMGTILSSSVTLGFGELGEFSNVAPAGVDGQEYNGIQMECPPINAKPGKKYQWYKNDFTQFIRPNAQVHTFISNNGKLYFSELTTSDQGKYHCLVTLSRVGMTGNYLGSDQTGSRISKGFQLNVKSGGGSEYQPIIQNEFIYVYPPTPMRGGEIILECFAYGTGPLIYTWHRENNKRLPERHSFDSNNRVLSLYNVKLEDGGKYTCKVESTATGLDDSKVLDLKIQAKPYYTYPLTHQHVDVGSKLSWHCEAMGEPRPTYAWYKNGEELTSSAGITVTRNSLVIDKVDSKRDSGMYQCAASNQYGTVYSSAQLRILKIEPSFEKSPMIKTMSASNGGMVTIICNPVAAPAPTYTWFKNGNDLGLDPNLIGADEAHYRLLPNGNLVIRDLQNGDQGKYTCRAENELGVAEDYSNLLILERTVISQGPVDQDVEVNMTATLLCRASHSPEIDMIYVWTFNDHIIDYDREPEYRQGEGSQKGSLYIISTKFINEGYYTCTATTGMDTDSKSAYLTVVGPPGEPAGVRLQENPLVENPDLLDENDQLFDPSTTRWLIWTDGQDHHGQITFYFVEFRTNFDMRWRVHPDGNNIPKFKTVNEQYPDKRFVRLTNLKAGAGVEFRVLARNMYGIGAPSLPTPMTQIPGAKPSQVVKNVRGGGGSVGDLTIVWDPMPKEDHNGPDLKYIVSWRTYEAGAISDSSQWRVSDPISHREACMVVPDFKTGLVFLCKFVTLVGPLNYYMPYEAKVGTVNSYGDGPTTEVSIIYSAEELPLAAPEKVYGRVYNATALLITWKPVRNDRESVRGILKGYKINYWRMKFEVETQAMQNIIELKPWQENLDEGLIIGLESVRWYEFNVQAYNSAGNGPKSSTYSQQTLNRRPSQYPTEVHVYSVEGFGVRVNFRGISTQIREEPLKGYRVQYWKAHENILNAEIADFGKLTTGVIRNLSSSELYQLRVYGYSRAGQGKRSSPSVFFTVGDGQILINAETTEIFGGVSVLKSSITITIISFIVAVILLCC